MNLATLSFWADLGHRCLFIFAMVINYMVLGLVVIIVLISGCNETSPIVVILSSLVVPVVYLVLLWLILFIFLSVLEWPEKTART